MPMKHRKGSVRIIAGEWRGRRLPVLDVPDLRPSGDRSRETLFNWLQAHIPGSACADLYAGSGALGIEAASRGAGRVALVENNAEVIAHLERCVERLKAGRVSVHYDDARRWLQSQPAGSVDILFVDPPFADGQPEAVLQAIEQSGVLRANALIYLESPATQPATALPPGWSCWREKVMGDVRMQVFRCRHSTVE